MSEPTTTDIWADLVERLSGVFPAEGDQWQNTVSIEGNWRERASCKGLDVALWFGAWDDKACQGNGGYTHTDEQQAEAKRICRSCPVRFECLVSEMNTMRDHAESAGRTSNLSGGIFAGLTESERTALLVGYGRTSYSPGVCQCGQIMVTNRAEHACPFQTNRTKYPPTRTDLALAEKLPDPAMRLASNHANALRLPDGRPAGRVAEENGISRSTFFARVRKGWDRLDAATVPPDRGKRRNDTLLLSDGSVGSTTAAANGIAARTFHRRVKVMGWDPDRAATEPPSNSRGGGKNAILLPDGRLGTEVAAENGIGKTTFLRRVRNGMDLMEAATMPPRQGKKIPS